MAISTVQGAGSTAAEAVLAGLDDEQRSAVESPTGPVCILAGAGTGKTRTITHRIAYGVHTGQVPLPALLAVTFTARAAGEMRGRLRALGVGGVQALTFHSAALRQLRYFWPRITGRQQVPELVERKASLVAQTLSAERVRTDRSTVRDVTAEIEWAKARMISPTEYAAKVAAESREAPLPVEVFARVYAGYEAVKTRRGSLDFDDLLLVMSAAIEEHPDVAEEVRARYRHFVVDEYQDVNPLQQRLLTAWLGSRDDLCVVGDASQTIYTFNGATPAYLVEFARRFPSASLVRLERDYRSTPQVVELANRVIAGARGPLAKVRLTLVGQRPDGPRPRLSSFDHEGLEASAVASACRELVEAGTPASQIAVLFRTNAQSEAYEHALADADVPTVLRGTERFFDRPEIRRAIILLRGAARSAEVSGPLADTVADVLSSAGYAASAPPAGGAAREQWEALSALVRLAEELPTEDLTAFVQELAERSQAQHAPTVEGVTLASLHAAKGLEWDAVFLVGLAEGTLPLTYATTPEQIEEERRLLYVGITRARVHLRLSWSAARSAEGRRGRRPSRFLDSLTGGSGPAAGADATARPARRRRSVPTCRVCGAALAGGVARKLGRCESCPGDIDDALFTALKDWRSVRAKEQSVPAYVVFTDATLAAIAEARPSDVAAFSAIPGVGPRKLDQYGEDVLAAVRGHA